MSDIAKCAICGEPMPAGEEMFKYHGYSGDCPKPTVKQKIPGLVAAVAVKDNRKVSMLFDTNEQANAFVAGIEADESPNVQIEGLRAFAQSRSNAGLGLVLGYLP